MAFRPISAVALIMLACAAAPWPVWSAAAAGQGPRGLVERLNATLLEVMRDAERLGYQGRYDHLAPVLARTFNFPLMARVSVGRHWRSLDEAQRKRLIDVFGRISIATFAARFDGYSGERFEVIGERQAPRKAILVDNRLIKSDGEAVAINYLLRKFEDAWRVVDVFLDAKYSELAMKRSEYTSVIANHGFDSLISSLEEKLARLAAEG
ncbi:MAG: ABC transporter substrate-binding protein [Kiloniellaceae bacterium]